MRFPFVAAAVLVLTLTSALFFGLGAIWTASGDLSSRLIETAGSIALYGWIVAFVVIRSDPPPPPPTLKP